MAVADAVIDEIQSRINLVELISRVTPLKQAGRNWKGLCPFHQEKTPSFMVSPEKQLYYCFGCQAGGNAVTFVMQTEQLTFPEAIEQLAARVGVTLERSPRSSTQQRAREAVAAANEVALAYFREQLREPSGTHARAYLASRGLTPQTTEQWELGYAPEAWEGLVQYAARKGLDAQRLSAAGLVVQRTTGHGVYDRFRQRVMFPIRDARGAVVGFGGRALEPQQEPKYLNSPETAAFIKGKQLFGLWWAKQTVAQQGALLVEGYLDCVVLHQAGLTQTLTPLGVALTEDHARLLKRYTTEATLLFDEDEAGAQATLRSLDVLVAQGFTVRIASLDGALDPDEFVLRQGVEVFHQRLAAAQPLFEYKLARLRQRYPQPSIEHRVAICHEMLTTLRRVPDAIARQAYVQRLAETLHLDAQTITQSLRDAAQRPQRPPAAPRPAPTGATQAELLLVGLLLDDPQMCQEAHAALTLEQWELPQARKVVAWLTAAQQHNEPVSAQRYLASGDGLDDAAFIAQAVHLVEACDSTRQAFNDCLKRLQRRSHEAVVWALRTRLVDAERRGNATEATQHLQALNQLLKQQGGMGSDACYVETVV